MADDERSKRSMGRSLEESELTTARVTRRTALGMIGGASVAIAVLGAEDVSAQRSWTGCTDGDPYDARGNGRRCRGPYPPPAPYYCTDGDGYDPEGRGRACGGPVGCTDGDRYDPPGRGQYCGTYCSDADPYDPSGRGRSCAQRRGGCYPCRGTTDYDGRDQPGCGCRPVPTPRICYDRDAYDAGRGRPC